MKKMFYQQWWFMVPAAVIVVFAVLAIVWESSNALQAKLIYLTCAGEKTKAAPIESVRLLAEDVSYESRFDNGAIDLYACRSELPQPLVVYAHGGYYVGGDKSSLSDYCQKLASYGYVVANMNYQLAPQGRYPTQILQVNEAIKYLMDHAQEYGIDPDRVFIAGDSAGAHLSSQMGLYYTNPAFQQAIGGSPAMEKGQLAGVVLHCGYYNTDTVRATGFPMIGDSIWMMTGVKRYEGTPIAEQMNTVSQITPDYPAVFIDCGDKDPFLTQAQEMIAALEQNGVDVTSYLPVSGKTRLLHEFQTLIDTPEGREAMERLAGFLGEKRG